MRTRRPPVMREPRGMRETFVAVGDFYCERFGRAVLGGAAPRPSGLASALVRRRCVGMEATAHYGPFDRGSSREYINDIGSCLH